MDSSQTILLHKPSMATLQNSSIHKPQEKRICTGRSALSKVVLPIYPPRPSPLQPSCWPDIPQTQIRDEARLEGQQPSRPAAWTVGRREEAISMAAPLHATPL